MIDRSEMGLKLDGDGLALFSLALGMGTTREVFQAEGTLSATMDMLNNLVRTRAILPATPFSIFEEMSSGPFALDVSSSCSRPRTSSVHNSSSEVYSNDGVRRLVARILSVYFTLAWKQSDQNRSWV